MSICCRVTYFEHLRLVTGTKVQYCKTAELCDGFCHYSTTEACSMPGIISALLAALPFWAEQARACCCVRDPGGLMLRCEKRRWLQPARWDVSILLEDCSEWDLDMVRTLLQPSGEVRVVCKCNVLENFSWSRKKRSQPID